MKAWKVCVAACIASMIGLSSGVSLAKAVVAKFETTMGNFDIKLFHEKAPMTVSNFVGLAKKGYYNGLIFHRVIPNFMIQGGDPQGTGTGGPGYAFKDEFHPELRHSKPGILSMANSGKDTNGSQFFITVAPTPHLDDRHSVFGEVIKGYDVVEKISKVDRESNDRPKTEVKITKLTIDGDFKMVEVEKVKKLSNADIEKITISHAKKLLAKISEAQGLGKVTDVKMMQGANQGEMIQAMYSAKLPNKSQAQLVIMGDNKSKFELKRLQFMVE